MNQTSKLSPKQFILAAPVLLGILAPIAPVLAQTVDPSVARAAQQACISVAQSRGFTVDRVVEVTADGVDAAKAVLSLTRNGQAFRLTCGYSKTRGAVFGDTPGATQEAPAPGATLQAPAPGINVPPVPTATGFDWSRLLWLLLPLIGLPLLLWLTRGRRDEVVTGHSDAYEGTVRKLGGVDVHSGPGSTYKVTGYLNDGQRVNLSGRQDNHWSELQNGGWIPSEHVETYRYANR